MRARNLAMEWTPQKHLQVAQAEDQDGQDGDQGGDQGGHDQAPGGSGSRNPAKKPAAKDAKPKTKAGPMKSNAMKVSMKNKSKKGAK